MVTAQNGQNISQADTANQITASSNANTAITFTATNGPNEATAQANLFNIDVGAEADVGTITNATFAMTSNQFTSTS